MSTPQVAAYAEKLQDIEVLCNELAFARSFFGKKDVFTVNRLTKNIEIQVEKLTSSAPVFGYSAEMLLATAFNDKNRLDRAYSDACSYFEDESLNLNYVLGLKMSGHAMEAIVLLERMAFCNPPSLKAIRKLAELYQYLGMHNEYIGKLEPLIMRLNLTPLDEHSLSSEEMITFFDSKNVPIEKFTEYNLFIDNFFSDNKLGSLEVHTEAVSDGYQEWLSHLVVFKTKHDPMKVSELNDLFLEELMNQDHLDEISDLVVTRFI